MNPHKTNLYDALRVALEDVSELVELLRGKVDSNTFSKALAMKDRIEKELN